jgi:hypothetical protein
LVGSREKSLRFLVGWLIVWAERGESEENSGATGKGEGKLLASLPCLFTEKKYHKEERERSFSMGRGLIILFNFN